MKFSPLDAEHRTLGARLTPFGGWDMPLQYESGTLAEHRRMARLGFVRRFLAQAYQEIGDRDLHRADAFAFAAEGRGIRQARPTLGH